MTVFVCKRASSTTTAAAGARSLNNNGGGCDGKPGVVERTMPVPRISFFFCRSGAPPLSGSEISCWRMDDGVNGTRDVENEEDEKIGTKSQTVDETLGDSS